ncbi:MAG: HEAT repeat domain-containing protein [Pseudomonadota bacterium]
MPTSSVIKSQVRRLLRSPDLAFAPGDWPAELEGLEVKPLLRALISGLSAPGEDERWRAVGLLGILAGRLAGGDLDILREVLRRLMWGLNEESGAILWAAPQAMGEILHQAPALASEFGRILCSYLDEGANFLEHPPLQAGVAWAMGRLALAAPEVVGPAGGADLLPPLLPSPLASARGCAAWALGIVAPAGDSRALTALASLSHDQAELLLLLEGRLSKASVGQLARQSLAHLRKPIG